MDHYWLKQWNCPMFPSEEGLCAADQTKLCLPGDWQQLCHCWATNQTKPLGLWNLDNIWIMRALSQKRLCLFLKTWAVKWLGLWKQLPRSLLYWGVPFLWQKRIPNMGRKQVPYSSLPYSLLTIIAVLQIPCDISEDWLHCAKEMCWTREGDVLTGNSAKQGDYCKLTWMESFPEMLSNSQGICFNLR